MVRGPILEKHRMPVDRRWIEIRDRVPAVFEQSKTSRSIPGLPCRFRRPRINDRVNMFTIKVQAIQNPAHRPSTLNSYTIGSGMTLQENQQAAQIAARNSIIPQMTPYISCWWWCESIPCFRLGGENDSKPQHHGCPMRGGQLVMLAFLVAFLAVNFVCGFKTKITYLLTRRCNVTLCNFMLFNVM